MRVKIIKILPYFLVAVSLISCQTKGQTTTANKNSVQTAKEVEVRTDTIFKELKLVQRIQSIDSIKLDSLDVYDKYIASPKSAIYSWDGSKIYVNSLEGYQTVVYDSKTLKRIKAISHIFNEKNNSLFKDNETIAFDYTYKQEKENYNYFMGKPVESALSHNGKYLWVTYYRRDFDENAVSPSAVAIIDTSKDEIIRVMPSGPLPKMIACSPDNKYIAVTHWGDNTVGIIDISSDNVQDFKYIKHIIIDSRLPMDYSNGQKVDRDNECGNCLRGTVFTPNSDYLLVSKMGGNGIAVIETTNFNYIGTIKGSKLNLRHIIINNNNVLVSSNKFGFVQKSPLGELLKLPFKNTSTQVEFSKWKTAYVGIGARTIDATPDGKYIFACVNNESKLAVIDGRTFEVIKTYPISKFPVGMAISSDGRQLVITSQGKSSVEKSGNAVSVFEIDYRNATAEEIKLKK
ncbi:MAG: hypothetical protein QM535_04570 [Limnohabitans sp.]|nr:hypothetical protein [Limnohabitans sp.]